MYEVFVFFISFPESFTFYISYSIQKMVVSIQICNMLHVPDVRQQKNDLHVTYDVYIGLDCRYSKKLMRIQHLLAPDKSSIFIEIILQSLLRASILI